MTEIIAVDGDTSDPTSLPRYACPNCGTTAGLAIIEQLDATTPVRAITRGTGATITLHTSNEDIVIEWDSSSTIGVLCRNNGCDFYHRGEDWPETLVYPIAAGPHPVGDNLDLD